MKKDIYFLHSAGPQGKNEGSDGLFRYLNDSLGKEYRLHHPLMPDPENPRYLAWKLALQQQLSVGGNNVILVGHSLGGSVLVKYLSEGLVQMPIAGLFLISAPWWGTKGWSMDEFALTKEQIAHLPELRHVFIYHSKKDKWVPYSHRNIYVKHFDGSIVREMEGDDHEFTNGLPVLIRDIQGIKF